jgi:hypothetical protein
MNILTDSTAVAVVGALKGVGYSLADITAVWNPAAPAVVTPSFTFGTNPGTVPDVNLAIAAMNHFGMKIARIWTWGPFTAAPLAAMWTDPLKYKAAGIANVAVLNFQNSAQRCKAPATGDWTNYLNAIPTPDKTGISYFEIGNEIDSAAYFSDTQAVYAALLHVAAPILRGKGYKIICGNVLSGLGWLNALAGMGAMADCDFVGCHAYDGTAAEALVLYQALVAFAAAHGKDVFCTEVGLHCNPGNLPAWAVETQKLYAGVKALGGTYLQFPLFPTGTTASPQSLLDAKGQPNQPFYSAAEGALA